MNIQGIITALLLSCVCAVGMMSVYIGMAGTYGIPIMSDDTNMLNKMSETLSMTENMTDITKNTDLSSTGGITDLFSVGFKSGVTSLKLLFYTPFLMREMIVDSAGLIGVPSYFVDVFIAILTLTVTLLIISIIVKWKVND